MTALLGAVILGYGQQLPELPSDPETRVGKLDNGMTYYIRHNDKPENRAEFYLATHVGAIQELPDQDGLAHFLEHMCFNGTKNFPGKGILDWLQSIGASFGGNVNASTGVEQTIYMLNNIPLVRPTVVDTCLLIMHDYSHFVSCDPEEIDKERGVILEEKRSRNNAQWRISEQAKPYLYGDTKYATTTIIGSEENLKTFKPESLTSFYHTWYRPDLQALIVVGDIDVDEVEAKIKSTFADIPAAENPKAKDVIEIPQNDEPIVGILTDPEVTSVSYEVYWKSQPTPREFQNTQLGLMEDLVEGIVGIVMNERLAEISAAPDAPFLAAGFGFGNLCETCYATFGQAVCKEDNTLAGFERLMTEIEKMKRFGFTDNEVERAKTELLSQYETAMKQAETRKNAQFVNPLIYNFFDNEPFMDPATEYEYADAILQQLSAPLINQGVAELIGPENMVVLYTAPEREGMVHPTADEIKAVITGVENAEIERPAGEDVPEAFLDAATLAGSKVVSRSEGLYGSTVAELANGVKVVMLPTDYEQDRISFNIYKKGGQSLISDEDMYSFESNIWALYQQNTGVSDFSSTTVMKMLSGKQLSVNPYIDSYRHGVSGVSTGKDLETALQLAYLYFADPRFDQNEYDQGVNQIKALLPNLESTPDWQLNVELYKTAYDSPRRFMLDADVLAKASLATIEKNYRELFKDAAGATMIMVGDFDVDTALPLVEKYVGSIAAGDKTTDWSYRGDGLVSGRKVNDFETAMETPMVTVVQLYTKDEPYSVENLVNYSALSYILDMVYTETLREEEGGTYGASAIYGVTNTPHPTVNMQVVFQTNPESADKLRELAVKGISDIAADGPSADHFDKAAKNLEKELPESKLQNSFWSSALMAHELYGIDDYIASYEAAVKALTPEKVQKAAADLTGSGNFIELVMRPAAE